MREQANAEVCDLFYTVVLFRFIGTSFAVLGLGAAPPTIPFFHGSLAMEAKLPMGNTLEMACKSSEDTS